MISYFNGDLFAKLVFKKRRNATLDLVNDY